MKKYSIVLLVILISISAVFYLWTAREAKKKSDDLLSHFKEIERSLDNSTDSAHNSKGIAAIQQRYPISLMKSQIILLIDSIKENSEKIFESSEAVEISKQLRYDLKRLLRDIQQLNKYKSDMVDSKIPDTLNYWARSDQFSETKWMLTFERASKEEIITYLNYLRNETLSIN